MPLSRRDKPPGQARLLGDGDTAPPTGDQADACYQAGLSLLGYRARTESEMRQRLARKGFCEAEIEATVARFKASGLIDDAAFAKAWSEARTASRPRSAFVVKRELRTRGIEAGTADEAVAAIDDGEACYRAALPRLKRLQGLAPEEARRKLADFLRRRGFGWTIIERTLARLGEEGLGFDTT